MLTPIANPEKLKRFDRVTYKSRFTGVTATATVTSAGTAEGAWVTIGITQKKKLFARKDELFEASGEGIL